jgi:hypothetical protein
MGAKFFVISHHLIGNKRARSFRFPIELQLEKKSRKHEGCLLTPNGRGHWQYSVIREVVADSVGLLFTKGAHALYIYRYNVCLIKVKRFMKMELQHSG